MKDIFDLLARILLSAIFIFEAYDTVAFYGKTKNTMTEYGLTWQQDTLLIASIVLLSMGGIFLLIGYRTSFAAILLLAYLLPVTFIVYSWWNDPLEFQHIHSILFMKNLAICGGLIMILIHGSGRYSVKRLILAVRVPKGKW